MSTATPENHQESAKALALLDQISQQSKRYYDSLKLSLCAAIKSNLTTERSNISMKKESTLGAKIESLNELLEDLRKHTGDGSLKRKHIVVLIGSALSKLDAISDQASLS